MTKEVIWIMWLCAGMFAVLLCFYIYLVIQKALEIRYLKKFQERRIVIEPLLERFLSEESDLSALNNLSKLDLHVLKELLQNYNQLFGDIAFQQRVRKIALQKLTELFSQSLRSYRFSVRLNTLYAIEEFRMENLLPELKVKLDAGKLDQAERFQIYRILAVLDDPDLFHYLTEQLTDFFPDYLYRELLIKLGDERFSEYVDRLSSLHKNLRYAVIDIIGIKADLFYLPILESIVQSEEKELRIRAMKAIARIGYMEDKQTIAAKAGSESWEERMMAAKVMGIVRWSGFLPCLQNLMSDSSWWVRTASAQSILHYPGGTGLLQMIANSNEDRYARDMAREWLEAM
ncbi:HEAT repeat domain-containing protein [Brevibacillus sp. SYSU BS000544]|uniref:HEAT repeat domain-containing protein n=1 Tax=Brevibacillus sp. SYSU BS000544 TaxID=3416443 RepID=UPI003CE5C3EE